MKTLFVFAALIASAHALPAADCDCTKVPYPPPCFKECVGKTLAVVEKKEMVSVLKIDSSTAEKIITFEGRKSARSLDDFKPVLQPLEIQTVSNAFKTISPADLKKITSKYGDQILPPGDRPQRKLD